MPKILIPNAYTWYNKGDASIVVGMIYALRHYIPDADITVLSFTPEIDQEKYKRYDVKVLSNLLTFSFEDPTPKVIKMVKLLVKMLKYFVWSKISIPVYPDEKVVLNAYADADIIVTCGGGYMGGHHRGSPLRAYETYFGKLLGKPVIVYGQSVERSGNALISSITQFVLNRVDLITVREEISMNYLKSLGIKPKVIVTADAAFLVKSIPRDECTKLLADEGIHKNGDRPLVGVTVRNWDFPGFSNGKIRFANYLEVVAQIAKYLVSNLNALVIFFPQVIFSPKDDDRIISNEIVSRIGNDSNFKVLTKDYYPEELKGIIGQMDLFIGTRMHSNIFALSMSVPTVAISYEKKTDGIMDMLGVGEYVVDISTISFDDMVSKISAAWDNRGNISALTKQKAEEVEKRALYNAELVRDLLFEQ